MSHVSTARHIGESTHVGGVPSGTRLLGCTQVPKNGRAPQVHHRDVELVHRFRLAGFGWLGSRAIALRRYWPVRHGGLYLKPPSSGGLRDGVVTIPSARMFGPRTVLDEDGLRYVTGVGSWMIV